MKIHECADQLNKLLILYNKIESHNTKFTNVLLQFEIEDMNFTDLYKIYSIFYDMYYEIRKENIELEFLFRDINFDPIYEVINKVIESLAILKTNTLDLSHIKTINTDTNTIHKIKILLDNIYRYFFEIDVQKHKEIGVLYEDIFRATMKARDIILKYTNNLEVPTMPDWEYEEYKKNVLQKELIELLK